MNEPFLKTSLALVLSAASMSAFAADDAVPNASSDQVLASFDRLFSHTPTPTAFDAAAAAKPEADALITGINTVLWEVPSYHVPTKYASLLLQPEK